MLILIMKNRLIIQWVLYKNIFFHNHSNYHYKSFHFHQHFHRILQLAYQLVFFCIYNFYSLNTLQHHIIYHILIHNYQDPKQILYYIFYYHFCIHICIYHYSNVVYYYKHLHLIFIYIYKFHAILYVIFHQFLTSD